MWKAPGRAKAPVRLRDPFDFWLHGMPFKDIGVRRRRMIRLTYVAVDQLDRKPNSRGRVAARQVLESGPAITVMTCR